VPASNSSTASPPSSSSSGSTSSGSTSSAGGKKASGSAGAPRVVPAIIKDPEVGRAGQDRAGWSACGSVCLSGWASRHVALTCLLPVNVLLLCIYLSRP
jgi:hypothetical protein